MREAGFTTLVISQRLGISPRTLQRHFARHGTVKGCATAAMLREARDELIGAAANDEAVRQEITTMILDDLAHARHLRQIMVDASAAMTANSLSDAVLVMRAAAAYSTALKNTSDLIRNAGLSGQAEGEHLPELVVTELTIEDVKRMTEGLMVDAN
ncbi:MAG: hypothetical protein B0A82_19975 [Alkalinema sp. CACIAM 70d]|nr:MAG: hypothetical protein B0A82_19975 [Alkalinema sp. CACIAM 70d]